MAQPLPPPRRLHSALGASFAVHVGLIGLGVLLLSLQPVQPPAPTPPLPTKLIYMEQSGPIGGGGGAPAPSPARQLEIPAHRPPAPVVVTALAPVDPPPVPVLDVAVMTNAAMVLQAAGTTVVALSGPGGGGRGTGLGSGKGPGVGPGDGGNTGGGPRQLGAGVDPPVPIHRAQPQYTAAAMQAKLSGEVMLEVVVLADGTVGDVRIIQSLDRRHGLDQEAIRAAKLWRFKPATVQGKPVDVFVRIGLLFRIY